MTKYFTLLTFLLGPVLVAQAQFKFGVAAGYEHISSGQSEDMRSGGGFSGGLLFRYSFSPHIEANMALTAGGWKTASHTYDPPGAAYIYVISGTPFPTAAKAVTVIHILLPINICYVVPLGKYSLFGGPGFFLSRTHMEGGQNAPLVDSRGLSLLAGIRWQHWQVAADYRPWLHNYRHSGPPEYEEPFDSRLSNDVSLKLGFTFGKVRTMGKSQKAVSCR